MDSTNILLLGVKGTVVALRRDTGAQLWATHLKSSSFVTVASDDSRVFAHTKGELFCLDLLTGHGLWENKLPGMGYDVASLALPDVPVSLDSLLEKSRQDEAAGDATVPHG